MPDITKLILFSAKPSFKNTKVYSGSVVIGGNTVPGLNVREFIIPLARVPDMVKALFNGRGDPYGDDPRPSNGWFKQGYIYVRGDNAGVGYVDYPTVWAVTCLIRSQTAIIRCEYVQQFTDGLSLSGGTVNYKITDYAVF